MAAKKAKAVIEEQKEIVETRAEALREELSEERAQMKEKQPAAIRLGQLRAKIQRGGEVLEKLCGLVSILLRIITVAATVLLAACYFSEKALGIAMKINQDNAFYRVLASVADLSAMDPRFQGMIGCFIAILTNAVLLYFIRSAKKLAHLLAENGRPFSVEGARRMRKTAWAMLILALYNVPMGLIATGMALLFSYLMEYGGYIQEKADETNRIQEEIIISFAEITENKSGQTGQHIRRVSEYSRILAEQMGLPQEQVENIRIASTMHDVGKLMIPTEILEKPGRLTDEEYAIIKTHTTYGGELLKNVEGEEMILSRTIALQHHERVDGKGYPAQLSGDQISLEGRIVAVADVYDALTSRRSYKDAWREEDAYQEIVRCRGTQFDPQVVDAFIAAHDKIKEIQRRFAD